MYMLHFCIGSFPQKLQSLSFQEPHFFLYSKGLRVLVKGLTPLNSTIQTTTANTTASVTANVTITTTATTVYCFNC